MRSSRANPIVYNDSDGVIKDQQIANLSIENADWAPIIAFWIKEKMPMCVFTQQAIMALKKLAHVRK